jgi:hypothetical protein
MQPERHTNGPGKCAGRRGGGESCASAFSLASQLSGRRNDKLRSSHAVMLATVCLSRIRPSKKRIIAISHRSCLRSNWTANEYRPCFRRARRDLANPAAVRGPVLAPPCIRHLPFGMAGDLQGVALRVFAPQRGALLGSPGRFPFLSRFPLPVLGWLASPLSELGEFSDLAVEGITRRA